MTGEEEKPNVNQIICLRQCNIGGKHFSKNDIVPQANIAPSRFRHLLEMGLITMIQVPDPPEPEPAPPARRKAAKKSE